MLENHNFDIKFNDFSEMPFIPYKIIEAMLTDTSEKVEDLWKLLAYSTVDCLSKPNLTFEEKKALIWTGESLENDCGIYLKPMVGSALDTAESQTQIRLYRYNTQPTDQYEAIICFEADIITNEKTCLVKKDGMLVERTDIMEAYFLNFINGRDVGIGSDYFRFDRELSRSCNSQLTVGNSKTFYGRAVIIGLVLVNPDLGE